MPRFPEERTGSPANSRAMAWVIASRSMWLSTASPSAAGDACLLVAFDHRLQDSDSLLQPVGQRDGGERVVSLGVQPGDLSASVGGAFVGAGDVGAGGVAAVQAGCGGQPGVPRLRLSRFIGCLQGPAAKSLHV